MSLVAADAVGDTRGELHSGDAVYASDAIIFTGNDGQIHVTQTLDNQELNEPIAAESIPLRMFSWKED